MSFTIPVSLIVFCLLLSCTGADLKSRKLRSLLSSTSAATSNVHQFLPSDGNFEYRISYQDFNNDAQYAIYSPGQTHEQQQWFHGANLFDEIKTSTDNTFGINVDDYCLYHSYVSNPALALAVGQEKTFYWFDCTYNPSQTLEKRIATHDASPKFIVFFSFQKPESNNDRIYDQITLSIKTITTDNEESVAQIPIYCVRKKTDMKIDETTSPLDMFPWEVAPFGQSQHWKYQIMFDKPMPQKLGDNNASNSNHLVMPLTVSSQFPQPFVYIVYNILLLMYFFYHGHCYRNTFHIMSIIRKATLMSTMISIWEDMEMIGTEFMVWCKI